MYRSIAKDENEYVGQVVRCAVFFAHFEEVLDIVILADVSGDLRLSVTLPNYKEMLLNVAIESMWILTVIDQQRLEIKVIFSISTKQEG